jgi:four helix bundle protein
MKIKKFEDLDCWKEARILNNLVYEATRNSNFARDYRLRDQITGTSISVMNNIAEGFGSQVNNEFIRFLQFSRRSALELQSCLYISLDQKYITQTEFCKIFEQSEKVNKVIDGFLRYLRAYKLTKRL